ncbi:MAG: M48 family metallopeptidase [Crocinitomicaceae bacterium]
MKNRVFKSLSVLSICLILLSSCGTSGNNSSSMKGINLFTVAQDKQFGQQVETEIASDPKTYPILDSATNKEVYAYLYKIRNNILNSGKVTLRDDFDWRVRIIKDDSTLNAFCTPGGYIYVYTGLMKYLDSEDQLAGVLAHEIGHADQRHSTRQMTTMYGIDVLLNILAGDRTMIKQITSSIIGLKFSRNHETEADQKSVEYLCPTTYNADGGAGFFEKLQAAGSTKTIEFLSTHPDPGNRIEHFHAAKTELGCTGNQSYASEYKRIMNKLP